MEFNDAFDPFRALKTSWTVLARAPVALLVGGGLLMLTGGGGGGGFQFPGDWNNHGHGNPNFDIQRLWPLIVGIGLIACCIGIAAFVFSSWVMIGFANCVEEVVRAGKDDIGTVFNGKGRLWPMVIARLLKMLIGLAAALPFIAIVIVAVVMHGNRDLDETAAVLLVAGAFVVWLPLFLYVTLGLALAEQAVALEGCTATESIRRSWTLVSGHRLMLLLYGIVSIIFTMLGLCACCIGVLVTGTMSLIAWNESYLALTRGPERAGWWIETGATPATEPAGWGTIPPPPPPPPPPSPPPPVPPGA